MAIIDFDAALGNHQAALRVHARRSEILAANLANADTPGYKARDIDFKAALRGQQTAMGLATSHAQHITGAGTGGPGGKPLYRVPAQPSLDGNTVEVQREQAAFAENAVRYQATLRFLGGRFKGLMGALKGE